MKLIDLLVKELPKCGGWPDGMSYCYLPSVNLMAPCATFAFGSDHKKDTFFGRNFCCEIELPIGDLDSDEYQSVVTREQYESALIASQKVEFNGDELESKTYRLDFGQWLEQQRGKIDVDCGCVSTETFMHWLRVAYESGNRLDTHPQEVPKPRVSTTLERSYLETALKIKAGHTLGVIDAMLVHEMAKALLPEIPANTPTQVLALMNKHNLPREAFWCFDHEQWRYSCYECRY
ncbi:hypothetical protein ACSYO5_002045 [Escherichia coli]